ncbi:MAG TPA: SRPBCC domain-containing protein [Microthrixaceae bacterium]|jgi:uncharacterized protein YndB with AHSA1/START domain|nr:SRPBCC domain-containing protein [Microthrixaceae bacterium]
MGARSYRVSRPIAAPAEVVWNLLTDASGFGRWNRAVLSIDGTIEVGNTMRLVSIADPKRTFKLTVAEMSAPNRMVWADGMPLGLFRGRRTYTITDRGDIACEFTMVEEFTGPLAPLITKAIPDLTESFDTFADSLKAAAEGEGPQR